MTGASLLASIQQRSWAIMKMVEDLPSSRSVAASSVDTARSDVQRLLEGVINQAVYEKERATDDGDAVTRLRPLLQYLSETVLIVDRLFGRISSDVPTSLVRAVIREIAKLGKGEVRPLITIGGPGNYETHPSDLWEVLYDPVLVPNIEVPEQRVRFFAIPSLEGGRALWLPIAAGHEVAHIALMDDNIVGALGITEWLTLAGMEAANLPIRGGDTTTPQDRLDLCHEILTKWTVEILCDLYAVRRFGPAGIAAQCDFLASIAAELDDVELDDSHPPAIFRAQMMIGDATGADTAFEPMFAAWRGWVDATPAQHAPEVQLLLDIIAEHRDGLVEALERADMPKRPYDMDDREPVVTELVKWFRAGISGVETVAGKDVKRADILNAGWIARLGGSQEPPIQAAASLETVDALVAKSLDLADFGRLWRKYSEAKDDETAQVQGIDGEEAEPVRALTHTQPGALTKEALFERFHLAQCEVEQEDHLAQGLVVFPSRTRNVSGASVDVRLGRQFIVFRRSSTSAFSALDHNQRPTEMQERVEKDWGGLFVLHPGELVLASTLEYIRLPQDLTAQVITRSSYGRLGLLCATAVQVQPTFTGCLTLELVNLGQVPLVLTPGERVAQLIFSTVVPPVPEVEAKYQFPTGPQFSRVSDDPDLKVLRLISNAGPSVSRRQGREWISSPSITRVTTAPCPTEQLGISTSKSPSPSVLTNAS